jgi:hypothetical protein
MAAKLRKNFVVYGYAREGVDRFGNTGTYYYIGKGSPQRPYACWNRTIKCPKNRAKNIHIIYSNLSEKEAFRLEIELISKYGRKDLYPEWGILHNRTNGGEGASGFVWREGTHSRYTPRCWCHVEKGFVFKKSSAELCRLYPKMELKRKKLNSVSSGINNVYKGWILVPDDLIDKDLSLSQLKSKFNPEYAKRKLRFFKEKSLEKSIQSRNSNTREKVTNNRNKGFHSLSTRLLISQRVQEKSKRWIWMNPKIGIASGYTVSELSVEFKHFKLDRSTLSKVHLKKQKSHKGWICLGEFVR